jgi:hypothetical protein
VFNKQEKELLNIVLSLMCVIKKSRYLQLAVSSFLRKYISRGSRSWVRPSALEIFETLGVVNVAFVDSHCHPLLLPFSKTTPADDSIFPLSTVNIGCSPPDSQPLNPSLSAVVAVDVLRIFEASFSRENEERNDAMEL